MSQVPKQLGFRMPAEWENHSAVWLAWPYDETTFPNRVEKAEASYCQIIKALQGSEKVELLVLDEKMKSHVVDLIKDASNINFHIIDYADVWIRDYGPTFLNKDTWVKWEYNAYGKSEDEYYTVLLKDNQVFDKLGLSGQKFNPKINMEGGAIDVNGQGALITTEQCLLNPNRNPRLNKNQIESVFKDYLGVIKIVWLKLGLTNDHTDGHVDDVARFVSTDTVVCSDEENPVDENHKLLQENLEILKKDFKVISLPMPHMKYEDGKKAPVSYVNFYIANKAVLVPTFGDPNDQKALDIIQKCFPTRKVIGIDSRDLIYGGGTIHCITQQQPAI